MIEKTTNYEIFKKMEANRNVVESNVSAIIKSIQQKNLLEHRPIAVDGGMRVLDGQHRLEAAKRLGVPIYYEIQDVLTVEDIPLMNIQRAWTNEDCCNYYAEMGNEHYIALKNFIKKHGLIFSHALRVITKDSNAAVSFKKGEFKFPSRAALVEIEDVLFKCKQTVEFIEQKSGTGNFSYLKTGRFIAAMTAFLRIKAVDFDLFMNKLEYRLDLVRICPTVKSYVIMLKTIYNYKNRNPISVEDEPTELQSF